MDIKLIKLSSLVFCSLFFSGHVLADTLCATGKVTVFEHIYGGSSTVRFKAETQLPNPSLYQKTIYGNMTSMWLTNDIRWRDRMALLKSAFENEFPVRVYSSDNNCMGPQDEFDIALCNSSQDCLITPSDR